VKNKKQQNIQVKSLLKTSETITSSKSRLIKPEFRDGRNYEKFKAAAQLQQLSQSPSMMIIEHLQHKVLPFARSPSNDQVGGDTPAESSIKEKAGLIEHTTSLAKLSNQDITMQTNPFDSKTSLLLRDASATFLNIKGMQCFQETQAP